MEEKIENKKGVIRSTRSAIAKINNAIKKNTDKGFKTYSRMVTAGHTIEGFTEQEVLLYKKRLSLEEEGRVPSNLKAAIALYRDKQKNISKDQKVSISGIIKVSRDKQPYSKVLTGYDNINKSAVISYNSIEGTPIWEKLKINKLKQHFAQLQPSKDGTLDIQVIHTNDDLKLTTDPKLLSSINESVQDISRQAYLSNKYFKANEKELPKDITTNPDAYKGQVFRAQLYPSQNPITVRYRGVKDGQHSFIPVLSNNTNTPIIINDSKLKTLSANSNIMHLSNLKHGYRLGLKNGELLYQNTRSKDIRWKNITETLDDATIDSNVQHYLKDTIHRRHDFYIKDSGANFTTKDTTYELRRHQASQLMHYRKLDKSSRISIDPNLLHKETLKSSDLPPEISFHKKSTVTMRKGQPVAQTSDFTFSIHNQNQKEVPFAKEVYDTRVAKEFEKQYSIEQYDTDVSKSNINAKSVSITFEDLGRNAQQLFIMNYMLREEERKVSIENTSYKPLTEEITNEIKVTFPKSKLLQDLYKDSSPVKNSQEKNRTLLSQQTTRSSQSEALEL